MVFPRQVLNVRDPGIGITQPAANTPVLSGHAFGGSTANKVLTSINNLNDVRSLVGYGPLAEDVALALQKRGGPVLFIIQDDENGVALSASSLTKLVGTGPTITATGTPREMYNLRLEIMKGGALGTATFRYSLDAWDSTVAPFTWSQTRVVPIGGSFPIPNTGLTLTFPSGTYVLADVYTLSTTPGYPTANDLGEVATVLRANAGLNFNLWLVSGQQPSATAGAAIASAFQGELQSLTNSFRYVRGFIDVGSGDTSANVVASALNWTGVRVSPWYGYVIRASALPFEGFSYRKCSSASGGAVRAFAEPISSDLARTASGPDDGVVFIAFDGFYDQTLDEQQLSSMRTWTGIAGKYIAGGKLKCPFGSDFTDVQFGRVMDVACRTVYVAQFPFMSESFRTQDEGDFVGAIDPNDAASLEDAVNSALRDTLLSPNNARGIPGHVTDVLYAVNKQANLATTKQLRSSVAIVPLGYAKEIITDLSFALQTA